MNKVQILSSASFLPIQRVKSTDLFDEFKSEQNYGISRKWMSEDMGIVERRLSGSDSSPSELAIPAAEKAINNAKIRFDEIDMIIFCGIERDRPEPATAHTIAHKLGINPLHSFDVSNACFGFIEGVKIAAKFIETREIRHALVVTAEVASNVTFAVLELLKKGMSQDEVKNYIGGLSIGDAGGAIVLGKSLNGTTGFDLFNTITLPKHAEKCYYHFDKLGNFHGQMKMAQISAVSIKGHRDLFSDTLKKLKWKHTDYLLSHQVGEKPWQRLSKIANCKKQESHMKTFDKLGNIASATFPVNFEKLLSHDKVRKTDKVMGYFTGSGLVIGQFGYTI